jgi:lipopolysaccharide/colanic/teichoic acid biosynthesis glycosyltransferase
MIRAARIFSPNRLIRLALVDAAVVTAVFYLLVRRTVLIGPSVFFFEERGAIRLVPLVAILLLTMYFSGLYESTRIASRIYLLQQLSLCAGVGLISQALVSYIHVGWTLPRNLALYGLVASIFALFGWRLLRNALLSWFEGTGTVLILGTDPTAVRIARHIARNSALHLSVAGCLTSDTENAVAPVLGGVSDVGEIAGRINPDLIVSGLADSRDLMPVAEMVDLRFSGCRIEEAGDACELICRHVSARDLRPSRMLFSKDFDARDFSLPMFAADIAASALLLIAGAPLALAYGALLRLSDGKPVVRKQICAGFQGRPFVSRQFRVKKSGGLAALARALNLQVWPQLWNVLSRRMSMVGPRPRRLSIARELGRLLPVDEYRQNARPGITGWAQINLAQGEMADSIVEVEYDLYYLRNQSISLYTYILLHGLRASV